MLDTLAFKPLAPAMTATVRAECPVNGSLIAAGAISSRQFRAAGHVLRLDVARCHHCGRRHCQLYQLAAGQWNPVAAWDRKRGQLGRLRMPIADAA